MSKMSKMLRTYYMDAPHMEFFRVNSNPIYGIQNPVGLIYLTRLRVGLSQLRVHKHDHNCTDTTSKFCFCSNNTPEHYLIYCPLVHLIRLELFENFSTLPVL